MDARVTRPDQEAWMTHGWTGEVPVSKIAPDPDQPRWEVMDPTIEELANSIKANGVRQRLLMTPLTLAPWVNVGEEYRNCFFATVAGHRRTAAAKLAGLTHVPVEVHVYESQAAYDSDAIITNHHSRKLAEIEEAYEIRRLRSHGQKWAQVADIMGKGEFWCQLRLKLVDLSPQIQQLLHPSLPKKERLGAKLAEKLGALPVPTIAELDRWAEAVNVEGFEPPEDTSPDSMRFALQELLLQEIQKRKLNDKRAVDLIERGKLTFVNSDGRTRNQPASRREIVSSYRTAVAEATVLDWSAEDLRRAYENIGVEEFDAVVRDFYSARASLVGFIEKLEALLERKKIAQELAQSDSRRQFQPDSGRTVTDPKVLAVVQARYGRAPST